jgi:hypothetical protein
LVLGILSDFFDDFYEFSNLKIFRMIQAGNIIGPVFDRGLLGLYKNNKRFDLHKKLREESKKMSF